MEPKTSPAARNTILVVDDEWQSVDSLSTILEHEDYIVHRATSGKEGLAILERERVDLVLLDVSMPVLDGFETLARIRVHKRTQDIPVIFLTGYMRGSLHMERGFNLGVNEYLVKPIETEELLVRVRSILRMSLAEKKVKQLQTDFFSMLVHDLRGPLSAVSTFTQMMLENSGMDAEERTEMLTITGNACEHMLGIVNDLLDISKLESDYVTLNCERKDINASIGSSMARMKPLAVAKAIRLQKAFAPDLPELMIDRQKIEQVMDNLIANAIKFTLNGGAVTVTTEFGQIPQNRLAPNGAMLPAIEVCVSDTGVGIAANDIPYLFDKYRQLKTKSISVAKGTGLGLAICKNIVEAHGGDIWVKSEDGKGSSFFFRLPLIPGESA
ncbi:MAG: response regulator [Ignavibacteriales bacterium]|nr:response regulator [Ignavibacteriales bacterium]